MTAVDTVGSAERPLAEPGGRTDLGTITISDGVVAKIAARAALDVDDAGSAAPRLLGRSLARVSAPGVRATSLDDLPKCSAEVDGGLVHVAVEISVRWPASVPATASTVRERIRDRVTDLTGLRVAEVVVTVSDLVSKLPPPPRVR